MSAEKTFLKRRQLVLATLLSAGWGKAFAQSSGGVSRIIDHRLPIERKAEA